MKIHHLALTGNAARWVEIVDFYDAILGCLGYESAKMYQTCAAWHPPETESLPEVIIYKSKTLANYQLYDVGFHHVAIHVGSNSLVDACFELVSKFDVKILDAPRFFTDYSDKYYALFLEDPSGIKLEILNC